MSAHAVKVLEHLGQRALRLEQAALSITLINADGLRIPGRALLAAVQTAPAWPAKSIEIVVGYSPGGANDILARLVGQKLAEAFGPPVPVDNRPGAVAIIGTDAVAKAAPGGYTLLR